MKNTLIITAVCMAVLTSCGSEEKTPEVQPATPQTSTPEPAAVPDPVDFNIAGFVHEVEELFRLSGDDYLQISRDQDGKSSPFYQEGLSAELKVYKFSMATTTNPLVVDFTLVNAASVNDANAALAVGMSSRLIDPKRHHYVFQTGTQAGHLALSCDYTADQFEQLTARLINALREPAMDREETYPCGQ